MPLRALELFREMQSLNLTAKHRTFSPLLEALAVSKEPELCLSLYEEMTSAYDLTPLERDYSR